MSTPSPILGPDGAPIAASKPITMQELLDRAAQEWKFKHRDEAFVLVLNAIAMISHGTGQALQKTEAVLELVKDMNEQMEKLKSPESDEHQNKDNPVQ